MRRHRVFWALVLVIVGLLLLLSNLNIIPVDVGGLIWPLALIVLGLWILWSILFGGPSSSIENVTIPLESATHASLRLQHGAGRLRIGAGTAPDDLLVGSFGGGVDHRLTREGESLNVTLRPATGAFSTITFPWVSGFRGFNWTLDLNERIPLSLNLETGAGEARLNLTDLRVTDLRLQTGASSTELTLPAGAGHTRAEINAGAASVTIQVPQNVTARIRTEGGLASISVDRSRFPRTGDTYQSPDYATSPNQIEIMIKAGIGSVHVR